MLFVNVGATSEERPHISERGIVSVICRPTIDAIAGFISGTCVRYTLIVNIPVHCANIYVGIPLSAFIPDIYLHCVSNAKSEKI